MIVKDLVKEGKSAHFTVVIPAEEFGREVEQAYEVYKNKYPLEGYAMGSAPLSAYREKFGETAFFQEALSACADRAYRQGLRVLQEKTVGTPSINGVDATLENGAAITFYVVLAPDVTLGQYKGLKAARQALPVTEEEISASLEMLRSQHAEQVMVTDRPAQMGDIAEIDFDGYLDGERFDGGKAAHYPLELGSGSFVPGFEEQLVGMQIGEDKDIPITFPQDYEPSLAGKEVVFKIHLHSLQAKQAPEMNDAFVQKISDFQTVDEYMEDLMQQLTAGHEEEAKAAFANDILKQASDNLIVDIPSFMIRDKATHILREYISRYDQTGSYQDRSLEELAQGLGLDDAALEESIYPTAVSQLRAELLLDAVIKAEKIQVSREEIDAYAQQIADQYPGYTAEDVKAGIGTDAIEEELKKEKAELLIVEAAQEL